MMFEKEADGTFNFYGPCRDHDVGLRKKTVGGFFYFFLRMNVLTYVAVLHVTHSLACRTMSRTNVV